MKEQQYVFGDSADVKFILRVINACRTRATILGNGDEVG